MNRYILSKIKTIKASDVLYAIIILMMIPVSIIYKKLIRGKRSIWLISEDGVGANDNGYKFFIYMRKKHPEIDSYYAIKTESPYFCRVQKWGNEIEWGTFKHWMYYLTADVLLSTEIGSSPYIRATLAFEIIGILRSKRVFLDHGINLNYLESLRYENNRVSLFTCCSKPETEYVKLKYGFPEGHVVYTGYARFDEWHHAHANKNTIIIMPTWRYWFKWHDADEEGEKIFKDTQYFIEYNALIQNKRLIEYAEANDIKILFYPHRGMKNYVSEFHSISNNVEILKRFDDDIQELLKQGSFLVTDYSSVCGDFAYMRKPIVYFQFDEEKYRKIYGESDWFSYRKNGFGPVFDTVEKVVDYIIQSHMHGFEIEEIYLQRDEKMFPLWDEHNCDRIFSAIIEMLGRE